MFFSLIKQQKVKFYNKNCEKASIQSWHWDLNSHPLLHYFPPITTRPQLSSYIPIQKTLSICLFRKHYLPSPFGECSLANPILHYYSFFNGESPASFCLFSFFSNNLQNKNCRLHWYSNSDRQSSGRARWPLDHHHCITIRYLFVYFFFLSISLFHFLPFLALSNSLDFKRIQPKKMKVWRDRKKYQKLVETKVYRGSESWEEGGSRQRGLL